MKRIFMLAFLLSIVPAFASAQVQHIMPKITVVDGEKNPELIPDLTAYHSLFLHLSTSVNPTVLEANRQSAGLNQLGLSGVEQIRVIGILRNFRDSRDSLINNFNAAATVAQTQGQPISDALLRQQLDDLTSTTKTAFAAAVSSAAASNLDAHVQAHKAHIRIIKTEAQ
jgi:hypothetical protein